MMMNSHKASITNAVDVDGVARVFLVSTIKELVSFYQANLSQQADYNLYGVEIVSVKNAEKD